MVKCTLELEGGQPVSQDILGCAHGLSFDAKGRLQLSWVAADGTLKIDDFEAPPIEIKPHHAKFRHPIVQRFRDGRWLIVECRAGGGNTVHERNAAIYTADLQRQSEFKVGDAVESVLIDEADQIWVGYFDENPVGLKRFSETGDVEYDVNQSSGHTIFDLYAMTLGADGAIWVYPYTDFYLGKLAGDQLEIVLQKAPVNGAHAIAVSGTHAAFFGAYSSDDITVYDVHNKERKTVTLMSAGRPLSKCLIATRKEQIAILCDAQLHRLHLSDLLRVSV